MMFKKIESNKIDATLTDLIDRYIKDYFISVDFEKNGMAHLWIGTRRDAYTSSETDEPSDDQ